MPSALLPRALSAAALLGKGQVQAAAQLLEGQDQALERLAALVLETLPPEGGLAKLAAWAGLYPDLLANALTRRYAVPAAEALSSQPGLVERPEFIFQTWPAGKSAGPREELRLKDLLPAYPLRVRLRLSWRGLPLSANGPLAVIQAQAQGPQGAGEAMRRELKLADLGVGPGRKSIELELPVAAPNQRWSFRLRSLNGAALHLEGVEVLVEPQSQVADLACWAFWAQGELMRRQGRPSPAAAILAWVENLDPSFGPGLMSQVEALEASGQPEAAQERLSKALPGLPQASELASWAQDKLKKLGPGGVSPVAPAK